MEYGGLGILEEKRNVAHAQAAVLQQGAGEFPSDIVEQVPEGRPLGSQLSAQRSAAHAEIAVGELLADIGRSRGMER